MKLKFLIEHKLLFFGTIVLLMQTIFFLYQDSKKEKYDPDFEYYKSGKIKMVAPPKVAGFRDGILYFYYENGHLMSKVPLSKGKIHGVEKKYYESGKIMSECYWYKGERQKEKSYYESGEIKAETPYTKGQVDGCKIYYYKSGKVENVTVYKMGKKISSKEYYESGKIKSFSNSGAPPTDYSEAAHDTLHLMKN